MTDSPRVVEAQTAPFEEDQHPRGTGAQGGEFVPKDQKQQQKAAPKAPAKKPAPASKPAPAPAQKPAAKPAPKAATPAAPPPGPPKSGRLNLKRGGQNDAAEVRNLQALLSSLKVAGVATDGQYGPATEAAVKAAQAKLGMKPTGRATSAFIRRMADAHALSPCIGGKVTANFNPSMHPHNPAGSHGGQWANVKEILTNDELQQAYGETLDEVEFMPDAWVAAHSHGTLTVHFRTEDPNKFEVFAAPEPDAARGWAEQVERIADEAAEYDPAAPDATAASENGFVDWSVEDGTLAGFYPSGDIAIREGIAGQDAQNVDHNDGFDMGEADSRAFIDALRDMADVVEEDAAPVMAAAGADVTPGHDELHRYWTVGEGRHLWVDSPTPWTTLVTLLTEHVGAAKAKVFASKWFVQVKGYSSGSDLNRVAHGHPPRGHNVGPG